MSLEKSVSSFGKKFAKALAVATLSSILSSCPMEEPPKPKNPFEYKTSVEIVETENIDYQTGGEIKIDDENNFLYGTELDIPPGSLKEDTTISLGIVNNPPPLPSGMNYVGITIDLQPEGTIFENPPTFRIPYSDEAISDAGLSDDSALKLYSYDSTTKKWEELDRDFYLVDSANNQIFAGLKHFSYYAITGLNCPIPEDLGNPQPGDLLYSLGAVWAPGDPQFKDNWMPGHVGIYVGEKIDEKGNKYNIIEAWGDISTMSGSVRRSYSNPLSNFSGANTYAGAREPKDFILTNEQRQKIVDFAEKQIGKPYAFVQTTSAPFGMARGSFVKGFLGSFNCVGLAEAAYEYASVNNGDGLVPWWREEFSLPNVPPMLTPAEQYNKTRPATGLTLQKILNNPFEWEGNSTILNSENSIRQLFRLKDSYVRSISVNVTTKNPQGGDDNLGLYIALNNGYIFSIMQSDIIHSGYDGWVHFTIPGEPIKIYSDSLLMIALEEKSNTFGWKYYKDTYPFGNTTEGNAIYPDRDFLFAINYF